jgi:hypothetical protein
MSQRFADPMAASIDKNVLEPLKSYFERKPFYYDLRKDRHAVGASF